MRQQEENSAFSFVLSDKGDYETVYQGEQTKNSVTFLQYFSTRVIELIRYYSRLAIVCMRALENLLISAFSLQTSFALLYSFFLPLSHVYNSQLYFLFIFSSTNKALDFLVIYDIKFFINNFNFNSVMV